jgi:hypothetical protein
MEAEAEPPPKPDGAAGVKYTFDSTIEGWHYTPYGSTTRNPTPPGDPAQDPSNMARLSAPLVVDSTNDADNRTDASGSLRGSVPFLYANERIDFQAFSTGNGTTGQRDWTGYIINAKVKLVSGGNFSPDCPLQAVLYVSTAPNYDTRISAPTSMTLGQWVTITYDMADTGLATNLINQMGIQINTGGGCPYDAGAPASDAAQDAAPDVSLDGGVADASDESTASDGGTSDVDAGPPPPPPQATTAVILIDNVIVSVK